MLATQYTKCYTQYTNAISERLCQQLHLSRNLVNIPISGVDGTITNAKYQVSTEVRSRVIQYEQSLDFLVLRKVTSDTPPISFTTSNWNVPKGLQLADPEFNVSRRIDMIIGGGHYFAFLREGKVRLAANLPMLFETVFGWIDRSLLPKENEDKNKSLLGRIQKERKK